MDAARRGDARQSRRRCGPIKSSSSIVCPLLRHQRWCARADGARDAPRAIEQRLRSPARDAQVVVEDVRHRARATHADARVHSVARTEVGRDAERDGLTWSLEVRRQPPRRRERAAVLTRRAVQQHGDLERRRRERLADEHRGLARGGHGRVAERVHGDVVDDAERGVRAAMVAEVESAQRVGGHRCDGPSDGLGRAADGV
mmetsp:Transcript_19403/g.77274  ORF Transcript_19403/g.77274 Transcript_19403/m.77274 type:complete len:201 (+) Transcript_19403:367-969(+)